MSAFARQISRVRLDSKLEDEPARRLPVSNGLLANDLIDSNDLTPSSSLYFSVHGQCTFCLPTTLRDGNASLDSNALVRPFQGNEHDSDIRCISSDADASFDANETITRTDSSSGSHDCNSQESTKAKVVSMKSPKLFIADHMIVLGQKDAITGATKLWYDVRNKFPRTKSKNVCLKALEELWSKLIEIYGPLVGDSAEDLVFLIGSSPKNLLQKKVVEGTENTYSLEGERDDACKGKAYYGKATVSAICSDLDCNAPGPKRKANILLVPADAPVSDILEETKKWCKRWIEEAPAERNKVGEEFLSQVEDWRRMLWVLTETHTQPSQQRVIVEFRANRKKVFLRSLNKLWKAMLKTAGGNAMLSGEESRNGCPADNDGEKSDWNGDESDDSSVDEAVSDGSGTPARRYVCDYFFTDDDGSSDSSSEFSADDSDDEELVNDSSRSMPSVAIVDKKRDTIPQAIQAQAASDCPGEPISKRVCL